MDIPIFIDTSKKTCDRISGENRDFMVHFSGDGLKLPDDTDNCIALQSITMSYTWNNIDAEKINNISMRYSSNNGTSWSTITFPNGHYTYSDISNFISHYL